MFVYTTFPSLVEAEAVAKVIVERRLAACANIALESADRDYLGWILDSTKPGQS